MLFKSVLICGALAASVPVFAQTSILEQMQNELAGIVKRTRGGVVTIEDRRPRTAFFNPEIEKTISQAMKEVSKSLADSGRSLRQREGVRLNKIEREKRVNEFKTELHKLKSSGVMDSDEVAEALKGAEEGDPKEIAQAFKKMNEMNGRMTLNFGPPKSGTGFCVGEGYVVTTADVLEGMQQPVVLADCGTQAKAAIIGVDPERNIGLLKLTEPCEMSKLTWGDPNALAVGHFAISIGNQSGTPNTVSLAFVSGFREEGTWAGERFYKRLIQIAGTVGAGASGGPLFNARGEVIGMLAGVPAGEWALKRVQIPQPPESAPPPGRVQPEATTHVYALGGGGEQTFSFLRPPVTSAGFAIPANDVRKVIEVLKQGNIVHAYLGVLMEDVEHGKQGDQTRVVVIKYVAPGSPSERGGLQSGDIVISINDRAIQDTADARDAILDLRVGSKSSFVVRRGNELKTLAVIPIRKEKPTSRKPD